MEALNRSRRALGADTRLFGPHLPLGFLRCPAAECGAHFPFFSWRPCLSCLETWHQDPWPRVAGMLTRVWRWGPCAHTSSRDTFPGCICLSFPYLPSGGSLHVARVCSPARQWAGWRAAGLFQGDSGRSTNVSVGPKEPVRVLFLKHRCSFHVQASPWSFSAPALKSNRCFSQAWAWCMGRPVFPSLWKDDAGLFPARSPPALTPVKFTFPGNPPHSSPRFLGKTCSLLTGHMVPNCSQGCLLRYRFVAV